MGIVEPCLLPRWDFHLFKHWPRLSWLLALRSRMPIFLAILARKDPRSSLALSWEGAAGSVVIQAPIVIAISGWPHGIPWLRSGSRVGAGLRSPRSLRRPSEWSRGLSPTIRRLDLRKPSSLRPPLLLRPRMRRRLPPPAACIGSVSVEVGCIPEGSDRLPRI